MQKKTGGGPPPKPLDDETEKVLEVMNHNTELTSPFDSESSLARKADVVGEALKLSGVIEEEMNEEEFELSNQRYTYTFYWQGGLRITIYRPNLA